MLLPQEPSALLFLPFEGQGNCSGKEGGAPGWVKELNRKEN